MQHIRNITNERGEVIKTVDLSKEKISVRSHKQDKAYHEMKTREGKSKSFVFTEMRHVEGVANQLTTNQAGYLLVLSTYVDYDGRIVKGNKEPMTASDMIKTLKLKERTFYDFLDNCITNGFIIKDDNGHFFINELIHFKGKASDTPLVKVYSTTIRKLFDKNKVSDLGKLYKLQSKIHVTRNVLVHNPNETNESEIEFMTRKDLAELLDISPKQVSVVINRLELEGMKVVASLRIGNSTRYVVNPDLVVRKADIQDETLRTLFRKGVR